MAETVLGGLKPAQVHALEGLLKAGYRLVAFDRFARYPAVEKEGFVALLDLSGEGLRFFGQVGLRMGEGIGMLVERGEGKTFVWHGESVAASAEMLAAYARIKSELAALLEGLVE